MINRYDHIDLIHWTRGVRIFLGVIPGKRPDDGWADLKRILLSVFIARVERVNRFKLIHIQIAFVKSFPCATLCGKTTSMVVFFSSSCRPPSSYRSLSLAGLFLRFFFALSLRCFAHSFSHADHTGRFAKEKLTVIMSSIAKRISACSKNISDISIIWILYIMYCKIWHAETFSLNTYDQLRLILNNKHFSLFY